MKDTEQLCARITKNIVLVRFSDCIPYALSIYSSTMNINKLANQLMPHFSLGQVGRVVRIRVGKEQHKDVWQMRNCMNMISCKHITRGVINVVKFLVDNLQWRATSNLPRRSPHGDKFLCCCRMDTHCDIKIIFCQASFHSNCKSLKSINKSDQLKAWSSSYKFQTKTKNKNK